MVMMPFADGDIVMMIHFGDDTFWGLYFLGIIPFEDVGLTIIIPFEDDTFWGWYLLGMVTSF